MTPDISIQIPVRDGRKELAETLESLRKQDTSCTKTAEADIGGVREWLTPQSGYLFRQDDQESLRPVITDSVTGGDRRRPVRVANLETVKRRAIFEENVAEQIRLMRSLVSRISS